MTQAAAAPGPTSSRTSTSRGARTGLGLSVLTDEDVRRIHAATLEIIETVGVRFPSPAALDIWAAHGATVDRATSIVRAPGALVEEAMRTAPPAYTLAARDPSRDLPLDGEHVHLATDGCGVEVIDLATGEVRRSELRDIAEIATVVDALDEIAFIWVPVSAQDMPVETRGLHEVAAAWRHSTKHVQTESIVTPGEARAAMEMAAALAGGADELRRRPVLSIMECTISPLAHDGGALEAALVTAEAGVPVGFMTMASAAFTSPATLAGTLAVGNAEVVSALALIQLAHPGAPVYYAAAPTVIDLRSGAYTGGGPEDFLFGGAVNALADFYRVPLSMGALATGAKAPDWQAGLENALSDLMASAAGSDMLLGAGLLHGSRIWSYEQLLLDAEIHSIIQAMLAGIAVDDSSLALDVIRDVGPGGDYLVQRHTRDHMRELWQPRYMDRRTYSAWSDDPGWARRAARERAVDLLRTHEPEPLDPSVDAELDRIIAGAAEPAAGAAR
jgi:trimethylamine--corrinoid protein Co-methyltransferase